MLNFIIISNAHTHVLIYINKAHWRNGSLQMNTIVKITRNHFVYANNRATKTSQKKERKQQQQKY